MGMPVTKFQIRNLPVGSEKYYLCFSEVGKYHKYIVHKNERGEITEVVNQSTIDAENEVKEYRTMPVTHERYYLKNHSIYPTAEPSSTEIYVYDDEKITFRETAEYNLKKIQAEQAIAEITNSYKQIFVTKEEIEAWISRHHDFYWTLQYDWNTLAFRPFQSLYFWFQYIADDFKHIRKAQQAVNEYIPFDEAWLVKYDRLYFTALMGWESGYEVFHEAPFILKQEFGNIHLIGEEFRGLYEFSRLFAKEYYRGTEYEDHFNSL
ncbi:MAG: hypothetical protein DWP98_01905 [Bacteroidetes bacterium]|nr:MAG: hypothetical protein DWP98_01905 [Bacteroidota bacterium]MBL1144965.1 hypothetical protein [Bacteroidota bacterium]